MAEAIFRVFYKEVNRYMAKFYGKVGYCYDSVETRPGIWEPQIIERMYYGDVIKDSRRFEKGESINDNLTITNRISILADAYAYEHLGSIRYVELFGQLWNVSSIDIEKPRIIFSLGGVYNGDTP